MTCATDSHRRCCGLAAEESLVLTRTEGHGPQRTSRATRHRYCMPDRVARWGTGAGNLDARGVSDLHRGADPRRDRATIAAPTTRVSADFRARPHSHGRWALYV